jgi:preprotein translocase subunit YajC
MDSNSAKSVIDPSLTEPSFLEKLFDGKLFFFTILVAVLLLVHFFLNKKEEKEKSTFLDKLTKGMFVKLSDGTIGMIDGYDKTNQIITIKSGEILNGEEKLGDIFLYKDVNLVILILNQNEKITN